MGRRRTVGLGSRCFEVLGRPCVEIIDVIANITAVLTKSRSAAGNAHLFQRTAGQADIMRSLGCVQEWTALLGLVCSDDLVVHGPLHSNGAMVKAPRASHGRLWETGVKRKWRKLPVAVSASH